jgi:large subunit ribosomal protein L10
MPSEKILAKKQALVADLAEEFKSAQTLVVASSLGLTVAQDTELRNGMRAAGVTYKVVKNTMAIRAAELAGLEGMEAFFVGPTAIAYSADDIIAPAKLAKQFAKKFEKFEVKGGASAGLAADAAKLDKLASIPDLPVLHTQLVFSLNFPIQSLAMVLNQIKEKAEEAGIANVADLGGAAAAPEAVVEPETEAPAAEAETAE